MILVTGGAGFIGSLVVRDLNRSVGGEIIICDNLTNSIKWKNLTNLKYDRYIHKNELFNEIDFQKVKGIIHMGACSATTETDMDYLMVNNVEYSKNLFNIAQHNRIPFIYASSAATYGAGDDGYSDDHAKLSSLKPLNRYGYSKQLVDEWIFKETATETLRAPWFGLKFFNVYGPNEYHKEGMRSMVHKAYGQIKESGRVKLFKSDRAGFKDGEQLRDFVYGPDISKAIVRLLKEGKKEDSGIYNLGAGKARSFKDLMIATFKAMGRDVAIDYFDMPNELKGQYQYFTEAKMDKFKKLFPDHHFSTVEEGVTDYVKNYLLKDEANY